MIEQLYYWSFEIAFFAGGIVYAYTNKRRENFVWRLLGCMLLYAGFCVAANQYQLDSMLEVRIAVRILALGMLIFLQYFCWEISWSIATYYSIWAFMSWQLMYELWIGVSGIFNGFFLQSMERYLLGTMLLFVIGHIVSAFTIAKWMPEGNSDQIGPRQLASALLIFGTFEIIGLSPGNMELNPKEGEWQALYLSQIMLAFILYFQNEMFKKSVMRHELEVMNLLLKKEQEQYELSKENIALINQKCHDLKHQIRGIRKSNKEEMEQYLEEMEDSIRVYEAIVKTGNEVLDTILTEKSLYCKEREITVSCVADGSQLDFINTIDLYAILGNALDNAIEAVEKFKHKEMRQIDVMIYRQQNFLVMNIVNPIKENLVYEEELPVSTKGDKRFHGFGLRSVRYLVKKYDGVLTVSEEDGCFSLRILIPIPST